MLRVEPAALPGALSVFSPSNRFNLHMFRPALTPAGMLSWMGSRYHPFIGNRWGTAYLTDELSKKWRRWVTHNLQRGCAKGDLYDIMIREGLDAALVCRTLDFTPPTAADESVPRNDDGFELCEGGIYRLRSPYIDLFVIDDFLPVEDCKRLVRIIKHKLRPSTTTDDSDETFRSSRTCDLGLLDDPFVDAIDRCICQATGIDPAFSEPLQGQYYQVGGEFKPHTDYFKPSDSPEYTADYGQRTWTFMIYLNNTEAGGETRFPRIDRTFAPLRGRALAWNNLLANGEVNPATLHHGMPVRRGHKVIVTKWFRERSRSGVTRSTGN